MSWYCSILCKLYKTKPLVQRKTNEKIQDEIEIPIINIVSVTGDTLSSKGFCKVGLLGTKFTMEMEFYKKGLKQKGIESLIPEHQVTRDYIQHTLKEELGRGIIKEETKRIYISIINQVIENGAEAIILACTEIPMFIKQADVSVPVFDTTKLHSQAAVEFALS